MESYLGLHALEGEWHGLLPRYLLVANHLEGKRVLEIGCGSGVGTSVLLERDGVDVVAIDHRPELIQAARAQFEAYADHFQMMFYEAMDFEDSSFDVVLCLGDEFPIDDEALLHEVRRVLRPSGTFIGAWSEPGSYGLDKVLPRQGDGVQSRQVDGGRTFADARSALGEVFAHVACYEQVAELTYLFRPSLKAARVVEEDTESQNDTAEFDIEAARQRQRDAERLAQNIATPSEEALSAMSGGAASVVDRSLLARGEAFRSGFELALCSAELRGCRLLEIGTGVRVQLPYYGVAARLGRAYTDLYRHMDDLGQTSLMLETQLEENSRLVDDLEEEVRSLRALIRDQARRAEAQASEGLNEPQTSRELAREQELRELTLDFEARLGEAQRSVEERDVYIDRLSDAVRRWEQYARTIQQELDARALALANLGFALERRDAENAELRAALSASGSAVGGFDFDKVPIPGGRPDPVLQPPPTELEVLWARLEAIERVVGATLGATPEEAIPNPTTDPVTVEIERPDVPRTDTRPTTRRAKVTPSVEAVEPAVEAEAKPKARRSSRKKAAVAPAETAEPAATPRRGRTRSRRGKATGADEQGPEPS